MFISKLINYSSAIEWESEISPSGEVFYIESLSESFSSQSKVHESSQYISPPPELTRRRSTRAGKLIRLIKRKESYRHSVRINGLASELKQNHESINKLNKQRETALEDFTKGEKYIVNIWIDPEKRHKLGRRATTCEAYLGIIPRIALDKSKIIVAGFVPDGEALKSKNIRVGDWLQNINSKEINNHNIDEVLSGIASPTSVVCQFQRTSLETNFENSSPIMSCPNVDVFSF